MTHWLNNPIKAVNIDVITQAQQRQNQLTKPTGALGRLETIAIKMAGLLDTPKPLIKQIHISTFAADHGVVAQGVSAYPQSVTQAMVANFISGGAAISVMAKNLGAKFEVIDCGVLDMPTMPNIISQRVGNATADISIHEAMTVEQCNHALEVGKQAAIRAAENNTQLFIGGEIGIGNTTASSAICAKLLKIDIEELTDKGTGLDAKGINHKISVIQQALHLHQNKSSVLAILQSFGGFEIVALVGAYLHCAQLGIPILVGGFISSTAALATVCLYPESQQWMLFSHLADEKGHQKILSYLNETPLIDLKMRLGEGSGAAVTAPLIQHACQLHSTMATFEEAMVANKSKA